MNIAGIQYISVEWMKLFSSTVCHYIEKKTQTPEHAVNILVPAYFSKPKSRHSYLHSTTVALATEPFFSFSNLPNSSPWAYLYGTLTFTLKLASFHPSIFRLNAFPLEGSFLILPSKGNVPLIFSTVPSIVLLCFLHSI